MTDNFFLLTESVHSQGHRWWELRNASTGVTGPINHQEVYISQRGDLISQDGWHSIDTTVVSDGSHKSPLAHHRFNYCWENSENFHRVVYIIGVTDEYLSHISTYTIPSRTAMKNINGASVFVVVSRCHITGLQTPTSFCGCGIISTREWWVLYM